MKKNCRPCHGTGYDQTDQDKVPWPDCSHCNGTGVIQIDSVSLVLRENEVTAYQ